MYFFDADRQYRPCSPVGGTEPTVDFVRDKPTGLSKPTDQTDDTCGDLYVSLNRNFRIYVDINSHDSDTKFKRSWGHL